MKRFDTFIAFIYDLPKGKKMNEDWGLNAYAFDFVDKKIKSLLIKRVHSHKHKHLMKSGLTAYAVLMVFSSII